MALAQVEDVAKPQGAGRFYFTEAQKARLHQEFRQENNPSKEWRQELAEELQVPAKKIDLWYGATRQKKKLKQEKKLGSPVGRVSINPVEPNVSALVEVSFAPNNSEMNEPIIQKTELVQNISCTFPSPTLPNPTLPNPTLPNPTLPNPTVTNPILTEPSDKTPVTSSSDFNSNLEKEKAALERMDAKEIARHFLNLGKAFNELKGLFDETEAKIKRKASDGEPDSVSIAAQDDSREKLLEQSEFWTDNDPSVPRGWSTKLGKNGANKGPRKIFRDPSGRIFYSRKQALNEMILKNTYTNNEIKLMESFCKPTDLARTEQDLNQTYRPEERSTFSKTIGEQVGDNNTEWIENDPEIPRGWKIKEMNGMTMLKVPPPSNEMYLSRISAYKALLDSPSGHAEEITVFKRYFEASGRDIESELRGMESEWKTDPNLPPGWKYTHTIREAQHRNSGYKRLLSFLTEKGTKLNSSLVALEYLGDAGYSNGYKERLKAFINSSKNNEKRRAEQLKASNKTSSFCPTLNTTPVQSTQNRQFEDFYPAALLAIQEPLSQELVMQEPLSQELVMQEPLSQELVMQQPQRQEFLIQEPLRQEFVMQEPIRQESMVQEPLRPESIIQEPQRQESVMHQNYQITPGIEKLPIAIKSEPVDPEPEAIKPIENAVILPLENLIKIEVEETEKEDTNVKDTIESVGKESHYETSVNASDTVTQEGVDSAKMAEHFGPLSSVKKPLLLNSGKIENSLKFGFFNNESFINKVTSETNGTLYSTALFEDTTEDETLEQYETAQWNESSVLIEENEEAGIPSHLSEHNYTVPQDMASQPASIDKQSVEEQSQEGVESKLENLSVLNETSLFYEADEIESSYTEEPPMKSVQPNEIEVAQPKEQEVEDPYEFQDIEYDTESPTTPMKPYQPLQIAAQKEEPKEDRNAILAVQFNEECSEIEDLEGLNQDDGDEDWTTGVLDDSNFESDEDELDAIQNMLKQENETLNESIREEEEINDFIQKEFAIQRQEKESEELENANKLYESAVKDLNEKHDELKKLVGSSQSTDNLLEDDVDNFLINDLLKSDEDDLQKALAHDNDQDKPLTEDEDHEKRLNDVRGAMRYEADPFLPDGWKQATYFVKKTGIEIHRYMSPDGQKFTSRKLMIFFMKTKGYSQEILDKVMEGTKCKRKSKGSSSAEESLEEPPPPEQQRKKVLKERFITSLPGTNDEKENNKRKRPTVEANKDSMADSSQNYNADISSNDEPGIDGGEKKRKRGRPRKEEEVGIVIKKEPNADSILEPVKNAPQNSALKEKDESSIGPQMSISRTAFKQLSALFLKSPIPSNSELASISKTTDVSAKDVKWWFIKIRHKVKINKVEKEDVKNYLDSIRICNYRNGVIIL